VPRLEKGTVVYKLPDICIPDRRHGITEMKWGSTRTLTKLRLESDDSRAPHAVGCDLSSPERSRRRGESARVILAAIRRRDGRTPPDARLPTTRRRAPAVQHWGGGTPTSHIPPVGSREPKPQFTDARAFVSGFDSISTRAIGNSVEHRNPSMQCCASDVSVIAIDRKSSVR